MDLRPQIQLWTTPQSHDSAGGNPERVRRAGTEHGCANLADDVTLWMTPNAPNGGRCVPEEVVMAKGATAEGKRTVGLESQCKFYPTPAQRDYRSPNLKTYSERGGETKGEQLANFVYHSSLPAPETPPHGETSSTDGPGLRRRLNPAFVGWLMGLPWWWTNPAPINLELWGMGWSSYRRQLRSALCAFVRGLEK